MLLPSMSHWTRLSRWQVYKQPPQRTFWLGQCSILTRLFSSENAPSDASKSVGKVVHLPGNPREPVRSELYGFKIYLHEGPCDQVNAGGGVAGKTGTKWVHPMRDAQPQKFVNVDGQTHILGVNTPPIDEAHWDATRNTTWNKGVVNVPMHYRRRSNIFSNYDFIMKSDYCMFWIPTVIIFSISVPTYCMTYMYDELAYTSMTVKVIGRQWYWVFEVESPTDEPDDDD